MLSMDISSVCLKCMVCKRCVWEIASTCDRTGSKTGPAPVVIYGVMGKMRGYGNVDGTTGKLRGTNTNTSPTNPSLRMSRRCCISCM